MAVFILSLLPVLYLTFVNRATGDDFSYGAYTRTAWMATHSFAELGKAMWRTIRQYYYGWQGTWFDIALFTLQPEVFSDGAYWIVAVLMCFLWIGSAFYLFKGILQGIMGFDKLSCKLITLLFLLINIQFIPSTKASIFWYNGCAHYMVPFAMCQMVTAWLIKYSREYAISTWFGIMVFMTLLGGANYQAALFSLIAAVYVLLYVWFHQKKKKIFFLLFPILTETAGLVISMKAPGNAVRAGEGFGFSLSMGMKTIFHSIVYGLKDVGVYWEERPLIFAGLLLLFLIFLAVFARKETTFEFSHPFWLSLMFFCLYSAMQAPAIYAGVDVSRGVQNTNFQVFYLAASGFLLIAAQKLMAALKTKCPEERVKIRCRQIVGMGVMLSLFLLIIGRSNIKTSTFYVCMEYIVSGQAGDYKEQMDLQTRLLTDETIQDVVLPFVNDVQGPLMHMPVTENPEAWTSRIACEFYGKNSVIAMPRSEWELIYGGG